MKPQDVGRSYNEIAEHWASDKFPAGNGVAQHHKALSFCVNHGSNKGFALDVGCGGNPRIPALLSESGFTTIGVGVSDRMLTMARAHGLYTSCVHADIVCWTPPRQYDFISAWDSIWHVPLTHQETLMRKLVGTLAPEGVLIFTMGGLPAAEEKTDTAMGPEMYYATLGVSRMLALLAEEGTFVRHFEFDQYPEPHAFVIAQLGSEDQAGLR